MKKEVFQIKFHNKIQKKWCSTVDASEIQTKKTRTCGIRPISSMGFTCSPGGGKKILLHRASQDLRVRLGKDAENKRSAY